MSYVHLHDLSQFYFEYTFLRYCGYVNDWYRDLLETRHQALETSEQVVSTTISPI